MYDWIDESGEPDDKYDVELEKLFERATAGEALDPVLMQQIIDGIEARDATFGRLLVDDPEGIDAILLQFPAYTGDPAATKTLQKDIEELWAGNDEAVTVTSGSVISVTVTDAITERQTESITTTIVVALGVLARLLLGDAAPAHSVVLRGGTDRARPHLGCWARWPCWASPTR